MHVYVSLQGRVNQLFDADVSPIHTSTYVCEYGYICLYIHKYIYTYIYIHIYIFMIIFICIRLHIWPFYLRVFPILYSTFTHSI